MSKEPLKDWAAIIAAAAKDHLGLIALALLVICFLTYQAMQMNKGRRKPPSVYLIGIASTLLIALLAFAFSRPEPEPNKQSVQSKPTQSHDVIVNGSQSTTGSQSPAIGNNSGPITYNSTPEKQ
jgi:hypothetical protein